MSTTTNTHNTVLVPRIEGRIQVIRGLRVIIDADLASLYGVPTKVLNQAVKRNAGRFPPDFMFQLDAPEKAEVVTNCDHLSQLKFSKALPFAFTEYGAVALANVLASAQAVEMGIYVVRAFVQLRQASAVHADLAKRLTELELTTERLELSHDTFSRNTRNQLRQVFEALRELAEKVTPAESPPPPKRSIGFLPLEDKPKGSKAARSKKGG
ncbi:MAG: ORF6N domain-containing protein [Burkholderiaceae bacterium]